MFVADLMRAVKVPMEISFLFASSYGSGIVSSGNVEIHAGKGFEPKGRDIIIVEDINIILKYLFFGGCLKCQIV